MSGEVAVRPAPTEASRLPLTALGVAVLLVAVCPPVATLARRSLVLDATQFAALALAVPALLTLGAPWRLVPGREARLAPLARLRGRAGSLEGLAALLVQVGAVVGWRSSAAVSAIQVHHALVLVEAATLLFAGLLFWTALVDAPPFRACAPPRRLVLATVAMWAVWIVAYVLGMAHGQGYAGFAHTAGSGLSAVADRQAATAVLFVAAAAAFLPIVFTSLFAWLSAEERRGAEDTSLRLRTPEARGVRREDVRPAR